MGKPKRTTAALTQRNYQGKSASDQLRKFEPPWPVGGQSSATPTSTELYIPKGVDADAPWYEVSEDDDGYKYLYCNLCRAYATDGHVASDKHRSREQHPQHYAHNWAAKKPSGDEGARAVASVGEQLPIVEEVPAQPQLVELEPWQTTMPNGAIFCKCCKQYFDEFHAATEKHQRRLQDWLWEQRVGEEGAQAPPQSWLVLKPFPNSGPEPYPYCLLCDKWVTDFDRTDPQSYSGSHGYAGDFNSQTHSRKLRWLVRPEREHWWQERLKWHPETVDRDLPSTAAATSFASSCQAS